MQTFGGNTAATAAEWGLFDAAGHLDASGHQGAAMGLTNAANYGMNTAGVRGSPASTGSAFAPGGLGTFDTSGLPGSDRYYGITRR